MEGITYSHIDSYLRNLIDDFEEPLQTMEKFAVENNVPIVQKETAKFLEFMVDLKQPKNILELGTAIGYSSILMYLASGKTSKITTIERNEDMREIAKKNFLHYGDDIKLIEGDALNIIKELNGKFDIIFVDAGKGHYIHFLDDILRLLDDDGIIIADNVLFKGMISSKELFKRRKITIVKRMRKYLEEINQKQYITSVLPIGDGIALTKRRKNIDGK